MRTAIITTFFLIPLSVPLLTTPLFGKANHPLCHHQGERTALVSVRAFGKSPVTISRRTLRNQVRIAMALRAEVHRREQAKRAVVFRTTHIEERETSNE